MDGVDDATEDAPRMTQMTWDNRPYFGLDLSRASGVYVGGADLDCAKYQWPSIIGYGYDG